MTGASAHDPAVYELSLDQQLPIFLDEQRHALDACLDDLTEEQARRRMVDSKTTLLGLVKHATFVERVWFEEAFTGRSRTELGIEAGPDESFELHGDDTIDTVRAGYRAACERSREAVRGRSLDDVVTGNRRGALPLRWILLHVLREVAQHCGHADILREQVRAGSTVFDAAGGEQGLLKLAAAWHKRVMADELVSHAFSHGLRADHISRLAAYWSEALGGPSVYSERYGDETSVVRIHSGNGPHDEMDGRAIACFDQALSDVGLESEDPVRSVLHDYFAWAATTTMAEFHESAGDVPDGLRIPRWSWDGLQPRGR